MVETVVIFPVGITRHHSYIQEHKCRRRFNLSAKSEKRELDNTVMDGDYECVMTQEAWSGNWASA